MKNLYAKILQFQKEIKPILKDQTNPYFKSKYANINAVLEEVKPALNKSNLILLQPLISENQKLIMKTILADSESAEEMNTSIELPVLPDAQKQSALITYYRRFAITSLLCLQTTDDDDAESIVCESPVKYHCARCKKENKETEITKEQKDSSQKLLGFDLCSSCLEIGLQKQQMENDKQSLKKNNI